MGFLAPTVFTLTVMVSQAPSLVDSLIAQNTAARDLIQEISFDTRYEVQYYLPGTEIAGLEGALAAQGIDLPNVQQAVEGQRIFRGTATLQILGESMSGSMTETIRTLASGHTEQRATAGAINQHYVSDIPNLSSATAYTNDRIDGRLPATTEVVYDHMGPNLMELGFSADGHRFLDELRADTSTDRDWDAQPYERDGQDGFLVTVTMNQGRDPGSRTEYFIDPSRGHLITHKTTYDGQGGVTGEVSITAEEIAPGVWFPRSLTRKTDSEFATYTAERIALNPGLTEEQFSLESLLDNPGRYMRIHNAADGTSWVQQFQDGEWKSIQSAGTHTPRILGETPNEFTAGRPATESGELDSKTGETPSENAKAARDFPETATDADQATSYMTVLFIFTIAAVGLVLWRNGKSRSHSPSGSA